MAENEIFFEIIIKKIKKINFFNLFKNERIEKLKKIICLMDGIFKKFSVEGCIISMVRRLWEKGVTCHMGHHEIFSSSVHIEHTILHWITMQSMIEIEWIWRMWTMIGILKIVRNHIVIID